METLSSSANAILLQLGRGRWRSGCRRTTCLGVLPVLFLVVGVGCTDAGQLNAGASLGDAGGDGSKSIDGADSGRPPPLEAFPRTQCDSLQPVRCALPWPSNVFMAPDPDRATGYTIKFGEKTLPESESGVRISPDLFTRMDGYGLGTPIMVSFPNIDTSELAGKYSVGRSMKSDAAIALLEVRADGSTERVPYWTELDVRSPEAEDRILFVRPAVILEEDTRYIVAFRDIRTTDGQPIRASKAFRRLRDGGVEPGSALSSRRDRFREVFRILESAGMSRDELTLAWDFRTASSSALHGRMLRMRDRGFQKTGPAGPELNIDKVVEYAESKAAKDSDDQPVNEHIALELRGSFEAPHFMRRADEGPGWVFNRNEKGKVVAEGTRTTRFLVRIPRSVAQGATAPIVTFGHGLLGDRTSVRAEGFDRFADTYEAVFVSADLKGMSRQDVSVARAAAQDLNNFQSIAERLHQGLLNFLLLTRAVGSQLEQLSPLTSRGIQLTDDQYYVGGSQGGIFGQTFVALSRDIERGYLAVPGNNFATLLQRSTQFNRFLALLRTVYPSPTTHAIGIAAIQLLWDSTDPVSYVRHLEAEPFGDQSNSVLLAVAKGDHQVAPVTNEEVARTEIGIPLLEHYDENRSPWGIEPVSYPHRGSGIVLFDFGNPWPTNGNRPPGDDLPDPHGKLMNVPEAAIQADQFLRTGRIVDVCNGEPCSFDR